MLIFISVFDIKLQEVFSFQFSTREREITVEIFLGLIKVLQYTVYTFK